jgi:transcriptional regulator with XRE-family HTH domain
MPTASKTTSRRAKPVARKTAPTKAAAKSSSSLVPGLSLDKGIQALARDLRSWTGFVLGLTGSAATGAVGAAADLSIKLVKSRLPVAQQEAVEKAGGLFRELRDAAGLTLGELGQAINLKDTSLLEAVEGGKVGLPFEVILRLAAVLGRKDPIPVVMKLTRAYNPKLWKTLEDLGVGRLSVQAGRERELANVYRSRDAARQLSDDEFAAVLGFVSSAFDTAMAFRAERLAVKAADA